uniref:WD40 repeat domain-containing protein n=1 Tax=Desertifilum tharense IPPAS B-1220 TaxID=1781255 RepID=A0ACD5GSX4_9CYAN
MLANPERYHQSWVLCVAFSPNGQLLASSSADRTLRLWCAATGELLKTWPVDGELVSSVAFTPDSRWLASAGEDGTLKIWDVPTGECLRTLSAHQGLVWSVAFSPSPARTECYWLAEGLTKR